MKEPCTLLHQLEQTLYQINLAYQHVPKFDSQIDFKKRLEQMKETHEILKQQVVDCFQATEWAHEKLKEITSCSRKVSVDEPIELEEKVKRRRCSQHVEKVFKFFFFSQCQFNKCDRIYGSEVSLSYHMKIKHDFTYSRRKSTVQNICV